jgi:hypothetical protein
VCGEDAVARASMNVNEELLIEVIGRSGMKMVPILETGIGFFSNDDRKGVHLVRRLFNQDYTLE